jgi:oligopeptide transport system ATP-binding protein
MSKMKTAEMTVEKTIAQVTDEPDVLLEVHDLKKYFPITKGLLQRQVGAVRAVDGISFTIKEGETVGLVGESGSGKTVTGRTVLQIYEPTAGDVIFDGINLVELKGQALQRLRRRMQTIFQNPYSSLDPRMPVGRLIREPMEVHDLYDSQKERRERVNELLELVGLSPIFAERYPLEFSGGQRQRIAIARALASEPDFIVCDDPISALDVSIQAQIVNLLQDLQQRLDVTYLFIAQDLSMLRFICDRIMIMYLGKIMENTNRVAVYEDPLHPYTQAVLSAVPIPDPDVEETRERIHLEGDLPDPADPPLGCNFSGRCHKREVVREKYGIDCGVIEPLFVEVKPDHWTACHLYEACQPAA